MSPAKKRLKKKPKTKVQPETLGREVRQIESPESADRLTVAWRVSKFDWDGPWGSVALSENDMAALFREWCCAFETQTWGELLQATGGRAHGNNHHEIPVEKLSSAAQKRLVEINLEDRDTVFSFRVSGVVRVYGLRDGRVFEALWYDPWHDDRKKAVYKLAVR